MRLRDKVAIVTGAASGFGEAIAELFAREGARLLLADIQPDLLAQVGERIGSAAHCQTVDVSNEDQVADMVAAASSIFGRLDILVNNAGIAGEAARIWEADVEDLDRVHGVNVRSVFFGLKHGSKALIAQGRGGSIVNMGSITVQRPRIGTSVYVSSKGAVEAMTRAAALDCARHNVRVNAISAVAAPTRFARSTIANLSGEARKSLLSTIPLRRTASVADVAYAACYLASDESAFLTGVNIPVEGGRLL